MSSYCTLGMPLLGMWTRQTKEPMKLMAANPTAAVVVDFRHSGHHGKVSPRDGGVRIFPDGRADEADGHDEEAVRGLRGASPGVYTSLPIVGLV